MRRTLAPLALSAVFAAACGSSSPSAPPPATPPSPASVNALADLPQDLALAPGDRNFWDLDLDFALARGGDNQFDRGVQLYVGTPSPAPTADSLPTDLGSDLVNYPYDQTLGRLSFTTPVVARGPAQLAALAASDNSFVGMEVLLSGSYGVPAAGGAPEPTRLSQAVDLTGAAAPLTLGWTHHGLVLDGTIPGAAPSWRVLVRDTASGNELIASQGNVVAPGPVRVDVSTMAGKRVTLDFELRGSPRGFMGVHEVSLTSGTNELLVNGNFDAGSLAPWTVTGPDQPCQVVSGTRPVHGLVVERRVLARPDQRWARFVDRFHNAGPTTITTQASYLYELGAGTEAVIQRSGQVKAVSVWDAGPSPRRRDLAIVFGVGGLPVAFRSSTATASADGSPYVWTRFPLTVAPGQTRIVVQFVVLTESRTGDTAWDATARAALADQEATRIASNFWLTAEYREGMTPEDQAALVNF